MYCFRLACKTVILTERVEEICLSLLGILCELSDCFFIPSFRVCSLTIDWHKFFWGISSLYSPVFQKIPWSNTRPAWKVCAQSLFVSSCNLISLSNASCYN